MTPHLLPPLDASFTRKCDDRRGSSGERDSWKGGGEGMEGEGVVKMPHFEGANVSSRAFLKAFKNSKSWIRIQRNLKTGSGSGSRIQRNLKTGSGSGSGSKQNHRIRPDPDPDPKPWVGHSFFKSLSNKQRQLIGKACWGPLSALSVALICSKRKLKLLCLYSK